MGQSALDGVVSHWHKLIENFQTSATGFYDEVEEALEERNIAGLKTSRVDWNEGGVLSPRREYLRVYGEHHCFDVCAAPFGNGYFFSSWVTAQRARFVVLYYFLFVAGVFAVWLLAANFLGSALNNPSGLGMALLAPVLRMAGNLLLSPIALLVMLWAVALLARGGHYGAERAMLTIPLVGWFYEKAFAPPTYYRLDTMYMFQSAVQSALQQVLNELLTAKGLRALHEAEFKPIDRQLIDKSPVTPGSALVTAHSN
jgi:hypothetical protein